MICCNLLNATEYIKEEYEIVKLWAAAENLKLVA